MCMITNHKAIHLLQQKAQFFQLKEVLLVNIEATLSIRVEGME